MIFYTCIFFVSSITETGYFIWSIILFFKTQSGMKAGVPDGNISLR